DLVAKGLLRAAEMMLDCSIRETHSCIFPISGHFQPAILHLKRPWKGISPSQADFVFIQNPYPSQVQNQADRYQATNCVAQPENTTVLTTPAIGLVMFNAKLVDFSMLKLAKQSKSCFHLLLTY